jgi:hypothetical protein
MSPQLRISHPAGATSGRDTPGCFKIEATTRDPGDGLVVGPDGVDVVHSRHEGVELPGEGDERARRGPRR